MLNFDALQVSWKMEQPNIGNAVYIVVYKRTDADDPGLYVEVEFQQRNVTLYDLSEYYTSRSCSSHQSGYFLRLHFPNSRLF